MNKIKRALNNFLKFLGKAIGWMILITIFMVIFAVALPFIGLVVVYFLGIVIGAVIVIFILYLILKWINFL